MKSTECQSVLHLQDLYFSRFSFEQRKNNINKNARVITDFEINVARNSANEDLYKVTILTKSKDELDRITLELETVGIFLIKLDNDNEDAPIDDIIRINTISIMMPFIRSQIALLTTQPGIAPIMLQPIDVNKLVANK